MNAVFGGPECLLRGIAILEVFQLCAEQLLVALHDHDVVGGVVLRQRGVGEVVSEGADFLVLQDGVQVERFGVPCLCGEPTFDRAVLRRSGNLVDDGVRVIDLVQHVADLFRCLCGPDRAEAD
ncbi:hypothetical protein D3C85_1431870 [compost metagenome]